MRVYLCALFTVLEKKEVPAVAWSVTGLKKTFNCLEMEWTRVRGVVSVCLVLETTLDLWCSGRGCSSTSLIACVCVGAYVCVSEWVRVCVFV